MALRESMAERAPRRRHRVPHTTVGLVVLVIVATLLVALPNPAGAIRPTAVSELRVERVKPKVLNLGQARISARKAVVVGKLLTLQVRTRANVKLRLDVVSGAKVVAKATKAVTVKRSAKHRNVRVSLNRVPAGAGLKLRVSTSLGKKKVRGLIRLVLNAPGCRSGVDTDRDTISDCTEIKGFVFTYYQPAAQCRGAAGAFTCLLTRTRLVTSNPRLANSDGDAVTRDGVVYQLTDAEEWDGYRFGGVSDPSSRDSDSDGLSDVEERKRWASDANNPDSDNDAGDPGRSNLPPNAELFDRAEVNGGGSVPGLRPRTSPTSDDSDGDHLSDLKEILNGTTSPVIADVPAVDVAPEAGKTFLVTLPTETSVNNGYALTTGSQSSTGTTDERVDQIVTSNRHKFSAELEGKVEKEGKNTTVGATAKLGYEGEWSEQKSNGHTVRFEASSSAAQERQFAETRNQSFLPRGALSMSFEISNAGHYGVTVDDLEVTASFLCPRVNAEVVCGTPGARVDISSALTRDGPFTVNAGETKRGVVLSTPPGDAAPTRALLMAFMENPNAIRFRVSNLSMTRDDGESVFGVNGLWSDVRQSDAGVIVDDGSGNVHQYYVATAVDRAWGMPTAAKSIPKSIGAILDEIGLDHETGPGLDPVTLAPTRTVLKSLEGKAAQPYTKDTRMNGAWLALSDAAGVDEEDFSATTVNVEESMILAYVKDADGDGIFDRDERLLGTSDTNLDTDGDGSGVGVSCAQDEDGCLANGTFASDWFESQIGWEAGPVDSAPVFRVYSNPATCDGDGDGSPDGPGPCPGANPAVLESTRHTDPNNPNTDNDLDDVGHPWLDGADPDPLVLNPAKGPLTGSWNGNSLTGGELTTGPRGPERLVTAAGTVVETLPFELCGRAEPAQPCKDATGYYRVTWSMMSQVGADETGRWGRFSITADRPDGQGRETLLVSDIQSWQNFRFNELYFATLERLKDVRLTFRSDVGMPKAFLSISNVQLEPVSRSAYFASPMIDGRTNPWFQAIALPGWMLLNRDPVEGSSQSAAVNPTPSGSGFAARTVKLPEAFRLPGGWDVNTPTQPQYVDEMANFRFSMPTGSAPNIGADQPMATVALLSGSDGPPPPVLNGNAYVGATESAFPLTEGHVFVGDVSADGSIINVLAENSRGTAEVRPIVYAPGQTGGLRLDHVVLQPLRSARDWIGNVREGGTNNPTDGPWWGYGMYGMSKYVHTAGGGGVPANDPGTALMPQSANLPVNWNTGITTDPTGTNFIQSYPDFVPVTPRGGDDRPKWTFVLKPENATPRCTTDFGAFQDPFYPRFWINSQGLRMIAGSALAFRHNYGQKLFAGTAPRVVLPDVNHQMGATQSTTNFGYLIPPCPIGGSLAKLGLMQAIVMNHPE